MSLVSFFFSFISFIGDSVRHVLSCYETVTNLWTMDMKMVDFLSFATFLPILNSQSSFQLCISKVDGVKSLQTELL